MDKVSAQNDPAIGLVSDGPIHYLCFNERKEYLMTIENMVKIENLLDVLENLPKGPACLVTFSSGKKFCTGFDLTTFKAHAAECVSQF